MFRRVDAGDVSCGHGIRGSFHRRIGDALWMNAILAPSLDYFGGRHLSGMVLVLESPPQLFNGMVTVIESRVH